MLHEENLIWIDLEMSGLDTQKDVIVEIATIVTDSELNIIAEGPVCAIHQPDKVLTAMDEWNTRQHTISGLLERVKHSETSEAVAEMKTLDFLRRYVPAGKSPMCGNSICQDRRFLHKHMPMLEAYFHYRHIDISTLKILAARWAPQLAKSVLKKSKHLALDDIRDSIDELRYYREYFLKLP